MINIYTMKKKQKKARKYTKGKVELPILIVVIAFSFAIVGGLLSEYHPGKPPQAEIGSLPACCDTGNGAACRPRTDMPNVTYNGSQYGLLKSNVTFADCARHLEDSGKTTPDGKKIILDSSDKAGECGNFANDQLADWRTKNKTCYPIPNDELIYVCIRNCIPAVDTTCESTPTSYYGTGTTAYNVYFRLSDYGVARSAPDKTPNGIPDIIQNCTVPNLAWNPADNTQNINTKPQKGVAQITLTPIPYPSHPSLQLHTFLFGNSPPSGPTQWIRPYCKPVIYLYPPKQEKVHVDIAPQGKLLTTIPAYTKDGWNVTANPNGEIIENGKRYDYLFYEASIPDSLIPREQAGYVISGNNLADFFKTVLPKLGLNTKEQNQFSAYWLQVLPKSAFYRITLVPTDILNSISPLSITPAPETILRVTFNFQPLEKTISIDPPVLPVVKRTGFTVVEWGGLFKQDKDHSFTCLM